MYNKDHVHFHSIIVSYTCVAAVVVLNRCVQNMDPQSMGHPSVPGPWTSSVDHP